MTHDQVMPPDMKILLDEVKADIFATLNCVQIGRIEKVTPSENTVEVTIQIKRLAQDNTSSTLPVLLDVPYFVLQGGGAYIDMPITSGDYCIVLFNDRNIDTWWSTANLADPQTRRKHSLSDGIALVGINPKTSIMEMEGSTVGIRGAGKKINIDNDLEKFDALISDLIDAIVGITTFGSPTNHALTPASQTALNAIKTRALNLFGGS